jgi:hypothetical protein
MSTEHERQVNRERQARWRLNNLEKARKQGRAKQQRYLKKKLANSPADPQIEFEFS